MVPITVTYLGDLRCELVHGPSGTRIETDAPADHQGRGRRFSPTDLVAAALGACMMTIVGIHARGRGWDLAGMRADVMKIMAGPPRRIARIEVRLHMPMALAPADRMEVEQLARTCPVARSLHPDLEADIRFEWPSA